MECSDCGEKMEYFGPVAGEGEWVYRSYKCPNCGRDALGSPMAKLLNKAAGWYGGGSHAPVSEIERHKAEVT